MRRNLTKDFVLAEAKKYKKRSEFKRMDQACYNAAKIKGFLEEACEHMQDVYRNWTREELTEIALRYSTRVSFQEQEYPAYQAALRRGMVDEICQHMIPLKTYWTDEEIYEVASKYTDASKFLDCEPSAYNSARYRGILDSVCCGMSRKYNYWSQEMLASVALEYKTKVEFQDKNQSAYNAAVRRGIVDDICKHMDPLRTDWTYEKLVEEALKYSTRNELSRLNNKAYCAARARGILDDICSHMEKGATGFDPSKPGYFYVVELLGTYIEYIGFGITNYPEVRLSKHKQVAKRFGFTMTTLRTERFSVGRCASELELILKRTLPIVSAGIDGFRKEAILTSDYESLKLLVDSYIRDVYNAHNQIKQSERISKMINKSKTNHCLDLGDIGEADADVAFNWYKARIKAEDDYDELEIEAVTIEINGVKLNVLDLLSSDMIEDLEVVCWESLEGE